WFIVGEDNIALEYILAVAKPNMWVERVVYHDIVYDDAVKSLAIFEASIEAKIVTDFVIRGAVVEIDIPAMIATPTVVSQNVRFDDIEQRNSFILAERNRVQVNTRKI